MPDPAGGGDCRGYFLNHTIYGRYLLALGRNEEAAKYSGINTDHMLILAYVICFHCSRASAVCCL